MLLPAAATRRPLGEAVREVTSLLLLLLQQLLLLLLLLPKAALPAAVSSLGSKGHCGVPHLLPVAAAAAAVAVPAAS